MTIQQAFDLALRHHQSGRLAEAEAIYRQILSAEPLHSDALHFAGVIAHQVGRNDRAVDLIQQAIALRPNYPEAHSNLGNALKGQGQLDEAIAAYHQAIELRPDYTEAHYNLGNALSDKGRLAESIAAFRRAIALQQNDPEANSNLGIALWKNGEMEEAIIILRRVIALTPSHPEAHYNLGIALSEKGQLDEAIAAYRQAIALQPNYSKAYTNLGNALKNKGQLDEAILAHRHAIGLMPHDPAGHGNLGNALHARGQLSEAIAAYRQAIALKPDLFEAHSNLGNSLKDRGQLDEAIAAYRQALALKPEFPEAHSNLVYILHFHTGFDAQAIAEEHRCWNEQHAEPLRQFIQPHPNDRTPERRLRIGYVSPDFRAHSVAHFLEELLACHDSVQFEVYCYTNLICPDAVTGLMRRQASHWREIAGVPDAQVAELIRKDGIDILVDLAGHTARNRLLVFARKPAPVQVTWLGYPDSTGLKVMDYRITDALADPPGTTEHLHSEQLVRLPDSAWCFRPSGDAPPVTAPPVLRAGHITFGCFNAQQKITPPFLKLWSDILLAVPGSRLVLKNSSQEDSSTRERIRTMLGNSGIVPERIELAAYVPTLREHLATYARVDIALDTFPYHGTTTTCEALWMGVPVITLAGKTHASRVGVSLLSNVGLPELVAESEEKYLRLAVSLANDLPRLTQLRSTLRPRMKQSPLMDAPRFAREIEAAYRDMWRAWCADHSSAPLS